MPIRQLFCFWGIDDGGGRGQYAAMNAMQVYFAETGENATKLAERIRCSPSSITRPMAGEKNASMDLALEIERGTGGKVTAEQFLAICLSAKRAKSNEGAE